MIEKLRQVLGMEENTIEKALELRRDLGALEVAREHLISESVSDTSLRPTNEMFGYEVDGRGFRELVDRNSSADLARMKRNKRKSLEKVVDRIDLEREFTSHENRQNLEIIRDELKRETEIPPSVAEVVEGDEGLRNRWNDARQLSDVEEEFNEMISRYREYSGGDYGELLSIWEPNIELEEVDSVIEELRDHAIDILSELELEDVERVWDSVEQDIDTSETLAAMTENPTGMHEYLANYILGGNPVRMPVRIGGSGMEYGNSVMAPLQTVDDRFWLKCFDTTAHEFGHTFGRENLSAENVFLPLGEPPSEAVDEGTARFYQNQVFRSREFLENFFVPSIEEWLGSETIESNEAAYRYFNAVNPDNRERISADPVTYPIHVAVRYELERELIESDRPVEQVVDELPGMWQERMQSYLGDPLGIEIEEMPESDTVLQDVHWGKGKLGYFPTYVLGDVVAANWRKMMGSELGKDFEEYVSEADMEPINEWVAENIWSYGKAVWEDSDRISLDADAYKQQMDRVKSIYE